MNDPDKFQLAGWRSEASNLKKRVKEQDSLIEELNGKLSQMRIAQQSKFSMIIFPRNMDLRREHLITLHNVMEHIRRHGNITPNTDYITIGFQDHRTLHRTCNKFVDRGILVKTKGNPTTFELDPNYS